MQRGVAVIALFVSACIQPDLPSCESKLCPADKVCYAGAAAPTCVYPEQLSECSALVDGDPCTIRNTPSSSCSAGICQPVQCGNLILTADEACDDGNNANGDGCSADCRSDETCGNAKLDIAMNEQCDDGNIDDLDDCRNNCELPRCNDGVLDPLEECEPSLGVAMTCSDFGYYTGALGCSETCRFDPQATCQGRCGDGVTQTGQGEECDGGPPDQTCVDLGYDYGAATCTSSCSAASCDRFGWTYLRTADFHCLVAGDNKQLAVISSAPGPVLLETPTGWTSHSGAFFDVDVHGSIVLAATHTTVETFEQGTWMTLTPPPLVGGDLISEVSLGEDDTPTILACSTQCSVMQLINGSWTSAAEPASAQKLVAQGANHYAVVSAGNVHYVWPGGSRNEPATNVVALDVRASDLVYYFMTGSDVYATAVPQGATSATPLGLQMGPLPTTLVAIDHGLVYGLAGTSFDLNVLRGGNGHSEIIAASPDTDAAPARIFATRDGRVIVETSSKLWELNTLSRTERGPPGPSMYDFNTDATVTKDGRWLVCEADVWISDHTGWKKLTTTSGYSCHGLWGVSETDVYASMKPSGPAPGVTMHWDGMSWTTETYQASAFDALAIVGTNTPVALLAGGVVIEKPASTWAAVPALPGTCTVQAIAMGGNTLYAAGSCPSNVDAIWSLSGSTWTEVYSQPHGSLNVSRLSVASDGTILAGLGTAVIANVGGMWTTYAGLGTSFVALSATDAFAITTGLGTRLQHWDGQRWSPMVIDSNLSVGRLVATPDDILLLGYHVPVPVPVYLSGYLRRR